MMLRALSKVSLQRSQRRLGTSARSMSVWSGVDMAPPDAILGLTEAFNADDFPKKVSVGVGAYRDDAGKPYVLPAVRAAEERLLKSGQNHEYAGIVGVPSFIESATAFCYGADSKPLQEGRIAATQALSGTGALRVSGEFFRRFLGEGRRIYQPDPTWGNVSEGDLAKPSKWC